MPAGWPAPRGCTWTWTQTRSPRTSPRSPPWLSSVAPTRWPGCSPGERTTGRWPRSRPVRPCPHRSERSALWPPGRHTGPARAGHRPSPVPGGTTSPPGCDLTHSVVSWSMRISEVIRRKGADVVTIRPEAAVTELPTLLGEHNIGAVVVSTDDGRTVAGIVSERDVVRHLNSQGTGV